MDDTLARWKEVKEEASTFNSTPTPRVGWIFIIYAIELSQMPDRSLGGGSTAAAVKSIIKMIYL